MSANKLALDALKAASGLIDAYGFNGDIKQNREAIAALEAEAVQVEPTKMLAKHQPCGCVVCTCKDDQRCHGCGAKHCGTHPVGDLPNPVFDSAIAQEPRKDVILEALREYQCCERREDDGDGAKLVDVLTHGTDIGPGVREVEALADFILGALSDADRAIAQEPVGEVVYEDFGSPFNGGIVRANFFDAVPEIGTKLYTTPQPAPEWQHGTPETGIPVLADIAHKYPIRAMWVAKHSMEVGSDCEFMEPDYNEEEDIYYWPEGWYEWNEHEETHWLVDEAVLGWMPLPAPRSES